MSRLSRLATIFAGFGFTALGGSIACERVPLLAPTGTVINLTLASDIAALNSSIDVIAVLIENGGAAGTGTGTASSTTGAGTPVQNGTVVSFTTTIGTIEPAEAKTQNGRVIVKLNTGGQSGKATVTAYSGGAKSTAQVTVGATAVDHILTTASPANLSANGGTTTVSARVEDVNGNALTGVQVQFTTTKGTLSASAATTNSNGVAVSTLTTTTAADVTATVGTKTGKVTVNVSTKAAISITGPTTTVSVSAPATFTINVGTTVPVTNVRVNYGDSTPVASLGQISGSQTVQHFFAKDDLFDVSVSATDPDGVVVTAQTQVAVVRIAASVAVTLPTGNFPKIATGTVTLGANSTSAIIDSYAWNFGDGTAEVVSVGPIQTHTYQAAGAYNVSVRANPRYGSAIPLTTQVVEAGAKAAISVTGPTTAPSVSAPASFTINVGSSVPATNVTVNYGDGTAVASLGSFSGSQVVQHFFASDGIFNVSATATGPDGLPVTAQTQVAVVRIAATVAVALPTGSFPKTATGTVTLATSSANAVIDSYVWNFGDATAEQTSFGPTQGHTYQAAGSYNVTVRLIPRYGSAVALTTQVVEAAAKASVSLTAPTTAVAVSAPASFTVNVGTSVPATNISVNYGDGTAVASLGSFSGSQVVQHFYANDGTFNVSATATGPDGIPVTTQSQVAIIPISATAAVTAPTTAGMPKTVTGTVTFSASSANTVIDRYVWDFGDSTAITSFGPTQSHVYTSSGNYTIFVRIVPRYGNAFTIAVQITIVP